MIQTLGFFGALKLIQAAFFVTTAAVAWLVRNASLTRRQAMWFGIGWVLLATIEFWIAGPWSFIAMSNELGFGPPLYEYLNEWHDGGTYTHAYAGGTDVYAMTGTGKQYLSLERLIIAALPFWLAHAAHKILIVSLGFLGVYRIARFYKGNGRTLSLALAAFYTLSFDFIVDTTWYTGVGYAIIPLAIYLVVLRVKQPLYFAGVGAVALLNAISSEPVHSVPVLLFAIGVIAVATNIRHLVRIALGLAIIIVVVVANWHEVIYALAEFGPLTRRFVTGTPELGSAASEARSILTQGGQWSILALAMAALWLSLRSSPALLVRNGALFTGAALAGVALIAIPWTAIGIKTLDAINFRYLGGAFPIVVTVLFADAARRNAGQAALLTVFLIALAAGNLGWYKSYNTAVWLSEGGVALFGDRYSRLSLDWVPDDPFRVVSIPYRLHPNFAPAMGLEALDGFVNLQPLQANIYWAIGVTKPNRKSPVTEIDDTANALLITEGIDFKCCGEYDIARIADVNLLGIANVRYVLSILPLYGKGIKQVSGPDGDLKIPRRNTPLLERLMGYLRLNFSPVGVRVYELPRVLPRVFAARDMVVLPSQTDVVKVLDLVAEHAFSRAVVVDRKYVEKIGTLGPTLSVRAFQKMPDGFDVNVDSPDGGVLVFNVAYLPFWQGTVNGKSIKPFPVNVVQTAVRVPAGARAVSLRYRRPLLRQRLLTALGTNQP